jgi:hypothetical protein
MATTYWTEIEYHYKATHPHRRDLKGGFVYAFVEANDAREALDKFAAAIGAAQLAIHRIVYVSPYEDTSWQKQEGVRTFTGLVKAARATKEVVFDAFYAFQKD